MQFMTLGLAVGFCLAWSGGTKAAWTSAKFPGEQDRAVQGCADNSKAGDWLCIVVRCDRPGAQLSVHFSAPGPDIQGNIELIIDEDTYRLSVPPSLKSPLPLSTRVQAVPNGLIDAMKSGHMITIQGSYLQPPYNQISLENSRTAIESVERTCGRPFPSAASLWRRITRGVGF